MDIKKGEDKETERKGKHPGERETGHHFINVEVQDKYQFPYFLQLISRKIIKKYGKFAMFTILQLATKKLMVQKLL